jgi:AcrR family transcriptional regulator
VHATSAPTPKPRTGGRSARVRKAVLDATLSRLLANGFAGLTVADVAADAGVAETTIYRRWPTKAALAATALAEFAATENPTPDTGNFESDLRTVLTQILDLLRRPDVERIIRALAALSDDVTGMTETRNAFLQTRVAGMNDVVTRATTRGELDEGVNPADLLETLIAPAYLRLLITGLPLNDALVDRSVRAALDLANPRRST